MEWDVIISIFQASHVQHAAVPNVSERDTGENISNRPDRAKPENERMKQRCYVDFPLIRGRSLGILL